MAKVKGPITQSPFEDGVTPKSALGSDHAGVVLINTDLKGIPLVMGTDVLGASESSDLFGWVRDLG